MRALRISRLTFLCLSLLICYCFYRLKSIYDYSQAHRFVQYQRNHRCSAANHSSTKRILFWTKIFSDSVNTEGLNQFIKYRCQINQCEVTTDRSHLCQSDALIFHARGGIRLKDLPTQRSEHQRYVLLSKEPPYKNTALVGHLDHFFNWTATVSSLTLEIETKAMNRFNR